MLIEEYLNLPANKLKQFHSKDIRTVHDLLRSKPTGYVFWNEYHTDISEAVSASDRDGKTVIKGVVRNVYNNIRKNVLTMKIEMNGNPITATFFHQNYLASRIYSGTEYLFYGRIIFDFRYGFQMNPEAVRPASSDEIQPVYRKIPGMSQEYISDCVKKCLKFAGDMPDNIPEKLRASLGVCSEEEYLNIIHAPSSAADLKKAAYREKAETLLPLCFGLAEKKYSVLKSTDKTVDSATAEIRYQQFQRLIPFSLTEDQEKTIRSIIGSVTNAVRTDMLIQGDVGCGKTVIAEAAAYILKAGGFQTAVMAPTTVLAEQHYNSFKETFKGTGVKIDLLVNGLKAKERREALARIASGDTDIVIGTHSAISEDVVYKNLGLTVVDEEHRFGVEQREALRKKAQSGAHSISMSATPIPRSLALSVYGEGTEVCDIRSMPGGRKPVITVAYSDEEKTYEAIYRQIKLGRQAYIVCPLIESNEKLEGVDSLEETDKKIREYFRNRPEVRIACISGRMKNDEIRSVINDYAAGNYDILLSTTIVEVGVNVPNATVMAVKNAERFGLAQLHQLRGRVGRGAYQSYCVLLSDEKDNPRITAMVNHSDGFDIAAMDLRLRGAGNLVGTEQSGFDEALSLMLTEPALFDKIKKHTDSIVEGYYLYLETKELAERIKQEGASSNAKKKTASV